MAHGRSLRTIGGILLLTLGSRAVAQQPQPEQSDAAIATTSTIAHDTTDTDYPLLTTAASDGSGASEHVPPSSDTSSSATWPRLTQPEYQDAGLPRFTLNGDLPYRETHVSPTTLGIFGGSLLALATTITVYQQGWYADSTLGPFNFKMDWDYSRQYDKFGHMFGGWMSAYCSYESFIASGLSKDDAALWGSIGGLFFQTFMEVQDGFHKNYGFDWTDEASNAVGAAYFYAQRKVPALQNVNLKLSIGASGRDAAREAAQMHTRLIVDDYDRQNVWLSLKVHNVLPESARPYWPNWLQLAVGYGVKDVELNGYQAYRTLYLSLDYDLVALLPDMGSFGNWLVQGLNNFHLPAPALQIYPDVKFALLFPIGL